MTRCPLLTHSWLWVQVSPHHHTLLPKAVLSLCSGRDRGKRCTRLRDTALPQDTAAPPLHGLGSTIPVPTGVHTNSLAWDIRCWGVEKQCPGCASGIVCKQQLVLITHHQLVLREQSNRAEDIFCIGSSSATSRIPARVAAPDRNRGIHKSWHIPSSWALACGKGHRAKCKGRWER